MDVLHIIAPGLVGGGESVVVGLARGLRGDGVQPSVATVVHSDPERHPVIRRLQEDGVPVHPVLVPHRAYVRERRAVHRLLETRRPDIVHTHGYRADLLDAGIARGLGIPTVTTIHGSSRMNWRTALYEAVQFRLLRRFQAVVAVSRPLVGDLTRAGVPPQRIHLVPNAWDGRAQLLSRAAARRALGLPLDAFVVGWVGRLIPVKGCDVFVHAVSRLRDPSVHASIVGSGPEQQRLEALVARHGLAGRVHFHGCREGAASLFRAFDVWVLSSRSEGTPMVLFEAMAAGVPIVAADVGGVADVVSQAEACVVPPEDPDTIAARLRDIRAGRLCMRDRVAAASTRLVERFSTARWIAGYVEVYRLLLGRHTVTSSTQTR